MKFKYPFLGCSLKVELNSFLYLLSSSVNIHWSQVFQRGYIYWIFIIHSDIESRLIKIPSELSLSELPFLSTQELNELDHFEGISSIKNQLVHNAILSLVFSFPINLQVHRMLLHYNRRNGDTKSSLGS